MLHLVPSGREHTLHFSKTHGLRHAYARNMLDLDEHAARDEASGWLLLGNERRMRRTDLEEPVDRTFLGGLRRTSPADLAADEAWRFAPVGVLSHVERDTINHAQLERFARAFGLPLVKMARAVLKRVIGFINLAANAVPWGNRERGGGDDEADGRPSAGDLGHSVRSGTRRAGLRD